MLGLGLGLTNGLGTDLGLGGSGFGLGGGFGDGFGVSGFFGLFGFLGPGTILLGVASPGLTCGLGDLTGGATVVAYGCMVFSHMKKGKRLDFPIVDF